MTVVVSTRADLAATLADRPRPLGLVPTMGALHDGHVALLAAARVANASVVASIFVNPLQFGPGEDFARSPRSLDADLARCTAAGVDVVWAPSVDDMYPTGRAPSTVPADLPGPLGDVLEGAIRPGHFAGMLAAVTELLITVRPDRAYFGEKDYQQLTLIRQLAAELAIGVEIIGVATVREADGLALSSRNVYLSADDRHRALALSRALRAGADAASAGADAVLAAARAVLDAAGIEPDYLVLRSAELGAVSTPGRARLLVAARIGTTRLIDNVAVSLPPATR